MKIVILPSARDDLGEGFEFYQKQGAGIGPTFWSRCSPTLIRSDYMAEFIGKYLACTVFSSRAFHTLYTTRWNREPSSSKRYWIVVVIRSGIVGS